MIDRGAAFGAYTFLSGGDGSDSSGDEVISEESVEDEEASEKRRVINPKKIKRKILSLKTERKKKVAKAKKKSLNTTPKKKLVLVKHTNLNLLVLI